MGVKVKAVLVLAWVCALSACASSTKLPRQQTKACTFQVGAAGGDLVVRYERAVIVGEVEGKPEWWLNFPERERVRDLEGKARAWNWSKDRVLRFGEARIVGMTVCQCPEEFW
jgi:hypothetical protein